MTKYLFIIFIVCLCLLGNTTKIKESQKIIEDSEMLDYFANNGFGNAVAVVQHPAGIYHKGITYVCYQGPKEDPYVASYNHSTKEWKGPFKAGVSMMGKNSSRKIDNHGKPSMIIDNEGYIHIAFGGHGGTKELGENRLGNYHYGKNMHVVSKNPLDISSWKKLRNISPFGTYNQFVKMDNGDIYLFYRHGAHRSNWVYQKSTDNGLTFDKPVSFLKHKRRSDKEAVDSWYPWIKKGNNDELLVVFDYHLCSDSNASRLGHIPIRYNIYYMTFDTKTGLWKNVKGQTLNMPLIREEADVKALVAATEGNWTFQGVVDVTPDGTPHIGMRIGLDINASRSAPKRIHHLKWNGTNWLHSKKSGLPIGSGNLELQSESKVIMYIEDELGKVSNWQSDDAGETFKQHDVLLSRPNSRFAISSIIENAHPDARLIVAEKEQGTKYRKMYLLGDNGPIQRPKNQAKILKN